jgi:hypothetical protein
LLGAWPWAVCRLHERTCKVRPCGRSEALKRTEFLDRFYGYVIFYDDYDFGDSSCLWTDEDDD